MSNTLTQVSLEEIAKRAGVSSMTVSRALAGKHKGRRAAASERAERIRRLAAEMGYRRNAAPRAMITGRFNSIAILRSSEGGRDHLPTARLRTIEAVLESHQMNLMLSRLSDQQLTDAQYMPGIMGNWMVDGLLVDYIVGFPRRMIDVLQQYRIPAIWMNAKHAQDCVHPDDLGGATAATEHLLKLGHRRILMWIPYDEPGQLTHYSCVDRRLGYEAAMGKAGMVPRVLMTPQGIAHPDKAAFAVRWLRREDRPTAVICYDLPEAMALLVAASHCGVRVPDDLSILTFHNEPYLVEPLRLTRMSLPEEALGRTAVEMLLKKIEDPAPLPPVSVPMALGKDLSCAPPPSL